MPMLRPSNGISPKSSTSMGLRTRRRKQSASESLSALSPLKKFGLNWKPSATAAISWTKFPTISTLSIISLKSAKHSPVVFQDPKKFGRIGNEAQQKVFETFGKVYPTANPSLDFVNVVSRTATSGAAMVRNACAEYRTLIDYGSDNDLTLDLKKVTAMINANLPTRIYYVGQGGYDTHAAQAGSQQLLLTYLSDAVNGFFADLDRIGRADDVAMMVFTEFGRRVGENASKGTDHGTATPMYILGKSVKGGFYGTQPSLSDLDDGNLKMTTDFRSVYGAMLQEWMGFDNSKTILKGDYPPLGVFG